MENPAENPILLSEPDTQKPEVVVPPKPPKQNLKQKILSLLRYLLIWIKPRFKKGVQIFLIGLLPVILLSSAYWAYQKYLKPKPVVEAPIPKEPQPEPKEIVTQKFILFEGDNYSFYIPEEISHLDRSFSEYVDGNLINDIYFNNSKDERVMWLREYIWKGYDDISVTQAMGDFQEPQFVKVEKEGIYSNPNHTFFKKTYAGCSEPPECPIYKSGSAYGYGINLNGLYVLIFNYSLPEKQFEEEILATFKANLTDKDNLSIDLFRSKMSADMTFYNAIRLFGIPEIDSDGENSILIYALKDTGETIRLGFGPDKKITFAKHYIDHYILDLLADLSVKFKSDQVYKLVSKRKDIIDLLDKNKSAVVKIEIDPEDTKYWLVQVTTQDFNGIDKILAAYQVDTETGSFK